MQNLLAVEEKNMAIATIESLEISEKLRISIDGKIYTIERSHHDDLFKKMRISTDELTEMKKLPSHLRDNLFAKYILKGEIKEVKGNGQMDLLL
jgi:hypothetical protein